MDVGDGCECTLSCGGGLHEMTCDGNTCTCFFEGNSTITFDQMGDCVADDGYQHAYTVMYFGPDVSVECTPRR